MVPFSEAALSILDAGIVYGATVTERIRTFHHRPYLLDTHLERLRQSLLLTSVADASVVDSLTGIVERVVTWNTRLLPQERDLAIVVFVTPGVFSPRPGAPGSARTPTVVVHTTPLPDQSWARWVEDGLHLVTPSVRRPAENCLDPRIKHRSRLFWFLGDRQAEQRDPDAMGLLLDAEGNVTETSSGNLMVFDGRRLVTPRPGTVLGGISQQVVTELAESAGITCEATDLTPEDVLGGEEAFLTSTGYCLVPVTRLNGKQIGSGRPGPLWRQLILKWSEQVGVDILAQHKLGAVPNVTEPQP